MKLINVVNKLISEGYKVSYYVRKDGGIVITRINGNKYKAKAGNIRARELIGESIAEEGRTQRRKASEQSRKIRKARKAGKTITDVNKKIESKLRRVQRYFRKNKVLGGGKPTKKKIREVIRERGVDEALRALEEAERYAKGLAYNENINDVIIKLKRYQEITDANLNRIIKQIERNRDKITDEIIFRIQYLMSSYANDEIDEDEFISTLTQYVTFE